MSVQPGVTYKRYAANGVTTIFTIPFLLLDASDLQITLDGVLVTSGFTLTNIGNPTSTCTFAAPPTGDLLFQQMMPFQRLNDYQINGDLLSETVNRDLDRLWLAIKQINRDSGRAFTVSPLEPEGIPPLPVKGLRASKVLAFDANGAPVTSNLSLAQIEEQPVLAMGYASAAAGSAVVAASSRALAEEAAASALASASFAGDPWFFQPLGVPIPVFSHLTGVSAPPTNQPYRYVKLSAADAYNSGVLTSESVSGSAPLVQATAVINLTGSPLNGQTVHLMNTEERVLRAGTTSGQVLDDQLQGHTFGSLADTTQNKIYTYNSRGAGSYTGLAGSSVLFTSTTPAAITEGTGAAQFYRLGITSDANGTPRVGNETRSKSISATYYMRVK